MTHETEICAVMSVAVSSRKNRKVEEQMGGHKTKQSEGSMQLLHNEIVERGFGFTSQTVYML